MDMKEEIISKRIDEINEKERKENSEFNISFDLENSKAEIKLKTNLTMFVYYLKDGGCTVEFTWRKRGRKEEGDKFFSKKYDILFLQKEFLYGMLVSICNRNIGEEISLKQETVDFISAVLWLSTTEESVIKEYWKKAKKLSQGE